MCVRTQHILVNSQLLYLRNEINEQNKILEEKNQHLSSQIKKNEQIVLKLKNTQMKITSFKEEIKKMILNNEQLKENHALDKKDLSMELKTSK